MLAINVWVGFEPTIDVGVANSGGALQQVPAFERRRSDGRSDDKDVVFELVNGESF